MEEKSPYTYKREKQRFSIRKTKAWGACSVFLGTSILFLSAGTVARADTTADASTRVQVVEQKTTVKTESTDLNRTSDTKADPTTLNRTSDTKADP
ncbi:YSIRK-type signal peptide-containing protein, partial [Lactobacillus delbrueckii]|uniref:YSIRK-type signal peptide-containing protein n=1 Tax=Lactobacillus delbrueckii TaxID=1584 RepID=UPI0022E28BFA